jgi:hypothetical protein
VRPIDFSCPFVLRARAAARYCKCRGCSLCKSCTSQEPGDIPFEGCESWCSVPEHCSHCKCKACSVCRACTPHDVTDTNYEDSQPWCTEKAHCDYCKCKGSPRCQSTCTPHNKDDDDFTSCQSWCKVESYHCPYCKCKGCDLCRERCMPWCSRETDCRAKACSGCALCKGHALNKRCEPWCGRANCRADACAGCDICQDFGDRVACHSGESNDVQFEECSSWCAQSHASEHCKLCSCRACPYCGHAGSQVRETGKPCPATSEDDSNTMRCELFCRETCAAHSRFERDPSLPSLSCSILPFSREPLGER